MTMQKVPAPRPWGQKVATRAQVLGHFAVRIQIFSKGGYEIARTGGIFSPEVEQANADFIVAAVNAHDALVAAAEAALLLLDKQRQEYNAAYSILPRSTAGAGPIAIALRAALALARPDTMMPPRAEGPR